MPKPEQISGAPIPMKIGNTTYRAKTLSDRDYDELSAYCRFKFLEHKKVDIDALPLTKEERQEMLTSAMLASEQVNFNSPEGSKIINSSREGIARVGWQMCTAFHPNVTYEEFLKEFLGDESDGQLVASYSEVNRVFIYLNIPSKEDLSEDEGDSDKEPKSNEGNDLSNADPAA